MHHFTWSITGNISSQLT